MNVAKAIRLRLAISHLVDVQQLKKQLLSVCSGQSKVWRSKPAADDVAEPHKRDGYTEAAGSVCHHLLAFFLAFCRRLLSEFGADVALQADDISRYCLRLVVFDMVRH